MLIEFLLLILGFFILQKSANWLIDGSVVIGKRLKLSEIFIGLTVVAIGTSFPEIIVNVFATVRGLTGIPVANAIGSNIANILIVIGVTAMITTVYVKENTIRIGLPLTLLATLIVALMAQESVNPLSPANTIGRIEGAILIIGFSLYTFYVYSQWRKDIEPPKGDLPKKLWSGVFALVAGIIGLGVSAELILNGAVAMIEQLGITEGLVGGTIIALGTSLPELATSLVAAKRGRPKLLVGNIVGSNMINLLLVLGLSALVRPLSFDAIQFENLILLGIMTIFLWFVLASQSERPHIKKTHGIGLVLIYLTFLLYSLWRG
ncbi:calcium/sodium antiporter [Candidatus Uhrbacteria bacterium]|nr:calcium/sodium antiporter [Candidatus Uhrbacteria bacterium]MBD3284198.1 calcium/sodium antiporter [Candidatus Uhrbacteria bacterium]